MAAVVHLAVWCARAEENKYSREEREATIPVDVLKKLGLSASVLMDDMPPIAELAAGLEDLVN